MKILTAFLAFISSLFVGNSSSHKNLSALPLNADIISYNETYFAPAVAEPGNFPWPNQSKIMKGEKEKTTAIQKLLPPPLLLKPVLMPSVVTMPTSTSVTAPLPTAPLQDPYLMVQEPIATWFWYSSFSGNSTDGDRILPEITFDREYWRIEVIAYWAPTITPPKPVVQKDYFKLEIYEKGTNKLVYTMISGTEETIHKFQVFKKPGAYYFKIYAKDPSQYEITFTISSKLAQ